MLLPYDITSHLWLFGNLVYELAPPEPAPAGDGAGIASTVDAPADGVIGAAPCPPPAQSQDDPRYVFKGVEWVTRATWGCRANPSWDLVSQDRKDADDERSQAMLRERRPNEPGTAVAGRTGDPSQAGASD